MSNENGHITRAQLRTPDIKRPPFVMPKPLKPLPLPEEPASVWDWLAHKYEIVKWGVRLSPYALRTTYGIIMKNWRTTVTGIVGAIALAVNALFQVEIPTEAIVAVTMFFVALFAADGNKADKANG